MITEQMQEVDDLKESYSGHIPWTEFYPNQILFEGVRSTYFKRMEFINTHQGYEFPLTDEEVDFHNGGVFNFGKDDVASWDHYCLNFD